MKQTLPHRGLWNIIQRELHLADQLILNGISDFEAARADGVGKWCNWYRGKTPTGNDWLVFADVRNGDFCYVCAYLCYTREGLAMTVVPADSQKFFLFYPHLISRMQERLGLSGLSLEDILKSIVLSTRDISIRMKLRSQCLACVLDGGLGFGIMNDMSPFFIFKTYVGFNMLTAAQFRYYGSLIYKLPENDFNRLLFEGASANPNADEFPPMVA